MEEQGEELLCIRGLNVVFDSDRRKIPAVQGLDLTLYRGRVMGLVGESGCGKSVTSLSVLGLLDSDFSRVTGSIRFEGQELVGLSDKQMQKLRGNRISMVFQEPMTSLNPVFTVCYQLSEVLMIHRHMSREKAREASLDLLDKVGLPDPERIADSYPHSLSGGQRQRVALAMALCCNPSLLIADEPTTALDVTIQAQVLDLLQKLQKEMGAAILFITHDLGVIAEVADDISVMYAGRVVESCAIADLFDDPLHPYTQGLLGSRSDAGDAPKEGGDRRLPCIPGNVPSPDQLPQGCSFSPRCAHCMDICRERLPELCEEKPGHQVRCWLYGKEGKRDG
jgi:peptide/nickel transport system ATP-binding protein